jgi:hypothetical protein
VQKEGRKQLEERNNNNQIRQMKKKPSGDDHGVHKKNLFHSLTILASNKSNITSLLFNLPARLLLSNDASTSSRRLTERLVNDVGQHRLEKTELTLRII